MKTPLPRVAPSKTTRHKWLAIYENIIRAFFPYSWCSQCTCSVIPLILGIGHAPKFSRLLSVDLEIWRGISDWPPGCSSNPSVGFIPVEEGFQNNGASEFCDRLCNR